MKLRKLIVLVVCLLIIPATMGARDRSKRIIDENKAVDQQLVQALLKMDVDAVMATYWKSPSLVVISADGSVQKGWDSAQNALAGFFAGIQAWELIDHQIEYRVTGDLLIALASATTRVLRKDGVVEEGKLTDTYIRQKIGKQWVTIYEHISFVVPEKGPEPTDSLYKRVGGYDTIATLVDDLFNRMATDSQLSPFVRGVSEAHFRKIRQLTTELLCEMFGGPCVYTGTDLDIAHAGLGIKDADWEHFTELLDDSLDQLKLPEKERNEVRAMIAGLRSVIVST